jgi:hypothetical protein
MKKILLFACCVTFVGLVSMNGAYAQSKPESKDSTCMMKKQHQQGACKGDSTKMKQCAGKSQCKQKCVCKPGSCDTTKCKMQAGKGCCAKTGSDKAKCCPNSGKTGHSCMQHKCDSTCMKKK